MNEEIFLKYQHYLFDEKWISGWWPAAPIHLYPPADFKPSPFDRHLREAVQNESDSHNGKREESGQPLPSDYEIELAARAYERLSTSRSFSLHGVKAEVLEHYLNVWKLEIAQERKRDAFFEELKNRDAEYSESGGWQKWSGPRVTSAEDRAWRNLASLREFKLDDLRPEALDKELKLWRAEMVFLHEDYHERHNEKIKPIEQLEKCLQLELSDFDDRDEGQAYGLENAETDFLKLCLGDESSTLLGDIEQNVDSKSRMESWENDAFQMDRVGERFEPGEEGRTMGQAESLQHDELDKQQRKEDSEHER